MNNMNFNQNNNVNDMVDIHDASIGHINRFGVKAENLMLAAREGIPVPKGFCLSPQTVCEISNNVASDISSKKLRSCVEKLIRESSSGSLVVRSSSIFEGKRSSQYSGLFWSSLGVKDFDEILSSISLCYKSSKSDNIKKYFDKNYADFTRPHLAVIVQEQIDCEYSGIVNLSKNYIFCEIAEGNLGKTISGAISPKLAIAFRPNDSNFEIVFGSNDFLQFKLLDKIVNNIRNIFDKVLRIFGRDMSLEFGISNGKLLVFQVKYGLTQAALMKDTNNRLFPYNKSNLLNSEKYGLKGAAMAYFANNNLFTKKMAIIPPNADNNLIGKTIKELFPQNVPVTIRNSMINTISLPRYFAKNGKQAIDLIINNKEPEWTTIVHEYIDVRSSFELLVTQSDIVLEHVPGIWESDNRLSPDAIISGEDSAKYIIYNKVRQAKFVYPEGIKMKEVYPICGDRLQEWNIRLKHIVPLIRKQFYESLPINIHFVEDKNGAWQFLNIRRGFHLLQKAERPQNLHYVSKKDDLNRWDGKQPLLLKLSTRRGKEKDLIEVAEMLAGSKAKIYIDFGVLSHPAMVLREYGLDLIPYYLSTATPMTNKEYEMYSVATDRGTDPFDRISQEIPVCETVNLMMVNDRDPICNGHMLVVSKKALKSIADIGDYSDIYKLIDCLKNSDDYKDYSWLLFERGRASFCTSKFTDKHGHFHIVPAEKFAPETIQRLVSQTNSIPFKTLHEALSEAAKHDEEYLFFGSQKTGYHLETPSNIVSINRRFIRTFLEEMLVENA